MKKYLYLILIFFLFAINFVSAKKINLDSLNNYIENALKEWKVPGLAIAVVQNDSVILAKGFGVKDINKNDKVDENTLFAIASNTKAYTAAAIAVLVDEGKISLDDPVRKYLPYFELYNPYVSEQMKIRDLLCHRTGLETFSGDLVWYGTNYSKEEVVRRAKFLKPVYGFREHYGYSNIMYIAAGLIIEKVTGKSWEDFITEKFLNPLGMKRTLTSVKQLDNTTNIAQPHTDYNGKIISIPYLNWDNVAPAGSLISSAKDESQWIKLQLHRGTLNNVKYFSADMSREMWSPHTIEAISKGQEKRFPSMHFSTYGLGWGMFDYHGKKIVSHSGGYDGMISYTALIPEENIGFVIMTNCNSSLYYPLTYKILDLFLSNENIDWCHNIFVKIENGKKADADEKIKDEQERIKNTNPSLNLNDYAGIYNSELYGKAEVTVQNNALVVQFLPAPLFKGNLKHWHFDTFEINFPNFPSLPSGKANFIINAKAKVESLRIDIPNPDFDFTELNFIKE